ncbi:MAG: ATP-binding protein [Oscillospiraceae bacterium]|nr:ATP-binding protein [Oscillospiraceae bacterium]
MEISHKRNARLIDAKITQYLLPGIMMSMALQMGNIVDTILIGNILGKEAMSAVSLALPVETLIQIPGYVLGTGGAIAAGIMLGKRDRKGASAVFTVTLGITVVVGLLFAVTGLFAAMPLGAVLAKGGNLSHPTGRYLLVSFLGAPVIGTGLLMMNFLGVENHPNLASAYLIASNVINLIFDYFLLKYTSLSTAGASLSTVLGFFLGMVVFIFYIRSPKRMIAFSTEGCGRAFGEAFKAGVPMLIFMVMTLIKALGLNFIILTFLGDDGMCVYTVCENVLMIVEMVIGGIVGIIPNIAGVLYGEKDYFGLRSMCKRVLRYSFITCAGIMILVMLLPGALTMMFGIRQEPLLGITSQALRVFMICLPLYLWNKFLISYYESIEYSGLASAVTFLQNGIFLLPSACIGILLGQRAGGGGFIAMALSYVVSELLTVLSIAIFRRIRFHGEDFYMVPGNNSAALLDVTIQADMEETSIVPEEIAAACGQAGIPDDKAMLIAVAAEEMVVNIIRYGGKKSHWIDLLLVPDEEHEGGLMLRIRDNGIPFNPTEYEYDGDIYESLGGIEIVRRLAKDITYIRSADMNNTVLLF